MPSHFNQPGLPEPASPFSHVVLDDAYAHLSGLVAADLPEGEVAIGDVRAETRLIMEHVRRLLSSLGIATEDIVRVDVHLADLGEIAAMDEVYRVFFAEGAYPARTCVEAARLYHDCRVEITCTARRRSGHEVERVEHDVGVAVAPAGVQRVDDLASLVEGEPVIGDGGT